MADGTLKVGTITTSSGSGTITIGQSGETITVPSGATFSATAGTMSGQNYPAFQAFLSVSQTLNNDTITTIAWDSETFDSDSNFDTSNYRFTPNKAGKYLVYVTCNIDAGSGIYYASSEVQKNGSNIPSSRIVNIWENLSSSDYSIEGIFLSYQGIVDMNGSSDYLTANAYMAGGGSAGNIILNRTIWGAYRIGA